MHHIYRSAYITIIAAGATDAESGLQGVTRLRTNEQIQGQYKTLALLSFSLLPWRAVLYGGGWICRGWIYQEGYFSRRRLIVNDDQVLFECDHGVLSEDLPRSHIKYHGALSKWHALPYPWLIYELIEHYSEEKLTYQSDILNAFRSITTAFQEKNQGFMSF